MKKHTRYDEWRVRKLEYPEIRAALEELQPTYVVARLRILAGKSSQRDADEEETMDIRPIKTEEDYEAALEEISRLIEADVEPDTPEGDRFEVFSLLVQAYEEEDYPVPLPDPIEAINYYMESRGLSRADLEPFIGTRTRVSEILNRRRPLTLRMIRNLQKGLGIPAEVLIQAYEHEDPEAEISSYRLHWPVQIELKATNVYNLSNVRPVAAAKIKSTPLQILHEAQYWYEQRPGELEN